VVGLPVLRLAFGLPPGSEMARIVVYVHFQISSQSSSDSFDQTEASVFRADTIPGDVDLARQRDDETADDYPHNEDLDVW
jgi:hypothetical protein